MKMNLRISLLSIISILSLEYALARGVDKGENKFSAKLKYVNLRESNYTVEEIFEAEMDYINCKYGDELGVENVKLKNVRNAKYTININIGTPKQNFDVSIDTGSNGLWVFSSECDLEKVPECEGHHMFKADESSTYEEVNKEYEKKYASGKVNGITGKDTVYLTDELAVTDQMFGGVTVVTRKYLDLDGILGLGMRKTQGFLPPFLNAVELDKVAPVYSIYLKREGTSDDGGEITFGGHNEAHIVKDSGVTAKLVSEKHFTVQMKDLKIGDKEMCKESETEEKKCLAILDSGTTYIVGPKAQIDDLHKNTLKGEQEGKKYKVNCEVTDTFPDLKFRIGDKTFVITPKEYIRIIGENCYTYFYGADVKDLAWVLGDPFLGKYYTEYNLKTGEEAVTFYTAK